MTGNGNEGIGTIKKLTSYKISPVKAEEKGIVRGGGHFLVVKFSVPNF